MQSKIILDTGVLVAILDKSDDFHPWAVQQWENLAKPLLTCEAVITESCFILQDVYGGEDAIMKLIERGTITIDFCLNTEIKSIRELMNRYQSVPMSFADACLVRMSELINNSIILTLDSDFYIYRKHRKETINLIIPN
ncbi:PIN domain-containing protein [Crocosphaera sp. UHCC 0190]|uniref:type II toxin-antitoxin system VapC family toxin n=1 Tax=Crocosphaera sp. UHCC 0190 TaxID=3110246 RepID=UPI002B20FFAF|nr:PIN domain-containing protein [Crocosphaera sp. UHCC 0190]MEA5510338.1 PIN domain-containing protein [Crocosphaera sp. UHCC 0190]